jgi:hypothetical protein
MGLRELMRVEVEEREPEKVNSLEYLQRIYRDPIQPTPVRMRAAIEALQFENPKLSSVGVGFMTNDTFAERLERAIDRTEKAKTFTKLIELSAATVENNDGE